MEPPPVHLRQLQECSRRVRRFLAGGPQSDARLRVLEVHVDGDLHVGHGYGV